MKLTTFILFVAFMQVSAAGLAQRVTLVEKGVTLQQVFTEINKQTGYNIFGAADQIAGTQKIDADFHDAALTEVLDKCLGNTQLTYVIEDKTIIIKQKEPTFLDKLKAAIEQTTIRGKVVDSLGYPIPGVTVQEKGIQNTTFTDNKGYYTLTVENSNATIAFSYIGYQTREIAIKDLQPVITLHPAENNLHEVVINKGYYDEKEALSTGDVSVVSAKIIGEQPVDDPLKAIEGYVPGIQITQSSGYNGSNETVRIRGQNSLLGNNNPLYIVDGVPFSSTSLTPYVGSGVLGSAGDGSGVSPFSAFNIQDIASIEVLKDADATAIYGSQGSNGVILITTKKGKAGDTKVDVDISQGVGQVPHFMDLMNTRQYLQIRHQGLNNDGIVPSADDGDFDLVLWDTTRNTNWQKVLLGNDSHYNSEQVSISGGTENTQFRVGSGYIRNTSVLPSSITDFADEKASLNFSLTTSSVNKRFQFQLTGFYVHDNNNLPQSDLTNTALTLAPDAPALYKSDGSLNWEEYQGSNTWSNPLAPLYATATAITDNLQGSALLSYLVLPGLKVQTSLGYGYDELNETNLYPSTSYGPPLDLNPNVRGNFSGNTTNVTWNIEPQVSYSRKIAKGLLNALLGGTLKQQTAQSTSADAHGFSSDALLNNPANATTYQYDGINYTDYRYEAIYARLGYTWDEKYLLNITGNRDGSSNFGPNRQFANFGSVGAGWIFSKEKFISDNLPWLSFGKLRGSYGTTGSDQIGPYEYLSTYSTISQLYQGGTSLFPTRIGNPYYSWEVDKKLEFGIEMGFLNDRINFTASWFRDRSGNQLVGEPLPQITGFSSLQYNLPALLQNSGTEFILNTVNVQSSSFRWSTTVNFTVTPQSVVESYPGLAGSSYEYVFSVGKPVYYGYRIVETGVNPADGVYQFKTPTGPSENQPSFPADYYLIGEPHQQWYGGISNSFTYKGFQLDVMFQFVKQTQYNYWHSIGNQAGEFNTNLPVAIIGNYWTGPGSTAEFGRLSSEAASDPNYILSQSNLGLGNASFVRLKNTALSYNLPQSWQKAVHLTNARIYVQGENLLVFDHYLGMDPETGASGLPPLRVITLGIHASL